MFYIKELQQHNILLDRRISGINDIIVSNAAVQALGEKGLFVTIIHMLIIYANVIDKRPLNFRSCRKSGNDGWTQLNAMHLDFDRGLKHIYTLK